MGSIPEGSSSASAGSLFQGIPGGGVGVAAVASPLSCTNPRPPCLGHRRIARCYSAGPLQHGVAWPPMVPLSLGKHGVGVGDATVAPHSLVVSRLPVQGNGRLSLPPAAGVVTQRMASCGQPCRPPGLWVYALVCLPAGRYLSARRSRMRACRMWCQQTKITPDKLQNLVSDQIRFCN